MKRTEVALVWSLLMTLMLAPTVVWSQPTRLGDTVSLQSEILDELRTVYVSLPASYRQSQRSYPVLYLLDGDWHFPVVASQVRYLSECGVSDIIAPELIVVGIENVDRDRDFTPTHVPEYKGMEFPTSGEASDFLQFLTRELIPFIDDAYRTVDHRVLGGWSFGGLFTIYSMLEKPGFFNAYLGISHLQAERMEEAGLVFEEVTRLYAESSFGHYLLGRVWQKSDDPVAARDEYLRAIQIESRQQLPDGLDLRHFRSRLAEVEALLSGPTPSLEPPERTSGTR